MPLTLYDVAGAVFGLLRGNTALSPGLHGMFSSALSNEERQLWSDHLHYLHSALTRCDGAKARLELQAAYDEIRDALFDYYWAVGNYWDTPFEVPNSRIGGAVFAVAALSEAQTEALVHALMAQVVIHPVAGI